MPLYTLPSGAGLAISSLGQALSIAYPDPPPDPEPGDIVPAMVVGYMDSSNDRQFTTVVDSVTTITGVYPFSIEFDCSGTRSAQLDSDDDIGAWWDIGYHIDYGEGLGGTWSLSGRAKDTDRGFPVFAHTYTTAGTFEARMTCRDSAGNQSFIRVNVVVSAPASGTTMTSGVIPTWVSGTVYNAPAGGAWGSVNFNGLSNIIIRKTGAGADPIFGTVTLDSRNEPDEVITRANGIRFMNCDVASVQCGNVGFDFCTFVGGRVRAISLPDMGFAGDQLISNSRTALQVSNVRIARGLFFQDTGQINETGDYVMIGELRSVHWKNVLSNRTTAVSEHNIRGVYECSDFRHCLFTNTGVTSRSYHKFQGWDCTDGVSLPANKGTPDPWPDDDTIVELATPESPTAAGGRRRGYPSSKLAIVDCQFGTASDGTLEASIGGGPENNDTGQPGQGVELMGHEYCTFYRTTWPWLSAQYTGRGVGRRDVRLNLGAGAEFSVSTGAGPNRTPDGWAGPYYTTGTRPVVVL